MKELSAQPIVIVGAGRSGTNMLRDVLTRLDGVDTWPCDEINYIWRYGNRSAKTDDFNANNASPAIVDFIRSEFERIIKSLGLKTHPESRRYIIEKTCANSLRVPFVDRVVPEAKYIFLVRDGRDVVASAKKRWRAKLDIPYLLAKAKYVPKSDLPYYATQYLSNRLSKLVNRNDAVKVWGPKFEGMQELASGGDLDMLCAAQWVECVRSSKTAFSSMAENKYITVRYEDFVENPKLVLSQIAEHLDMPYENDALSQAVSIVRKDSVGNGLSEPLSDPVMNLLEPTLNEFDYS